MPGCRYHHGERIGTLMSETVKVARCKTRDCIAALAIEGIFASQKDLRDAGWILLDDDVFCPVCALQALADKVNRVLKEEK